MLGHSHGFFDPNVWFNEDELRQQVESFARCIVITGQEAPETHRNPYGYTTRMFSILGWKRLEVNRMMRFAGIDSKFQSAFRRALIHKRKARFHHQTTLHHLHENHELDGHFVADPAWKQFLISGPACAAGLKVQHAFECQYGQERCLKMIDYATGGDGHLTEDKMRESCRLKLRVRHSDAVDAGAGVVLEIESSQAVRDEEESKFENLRKALMEPLLQNTKSDFSFFEFSKKKFSGADSLPDSKILPK